MEKLELNDFKKFKKAIQNASRLIYELSEYSSLDINKILDLIRIEVEILSLKNDTKKLS